jgi:hypothetical protein
MTNKTSRAAVVASALLTLTATTAVLAANTTMKPEVLVADAVTPPKPDQPDNKEVVITGAAHISITAQWNEARDGAASYQAPADYEIKSATIHVNSAARASYHVDVSNDRRQANHVAHARGQGEWWNKARGWYDGDLVIVLIPKKS